MQSSNYNDQLIQTLTARMQNLQLQAAAKGIDTPPAVIMEIEELAGKIELVRVSSRDTITVSMLEKMEPAERWKRLYDATWELEVYMHTMQKNRETDQARIAERHREFNERQQEQGHTIAGIQHSLNRVYVVLIIMVVLFPLALALALHFTR